MEEESAVMFTLSTPEKLQASGRFSEVVLL